MDWWGTGCLLYEMLIGRPPFYAADDNEQFDKILAGKVFLPHGVSEPARDIIVKFLQCKPCL